MKDDRLAFFRQTTWMVIATVVGGVFMALVQAAAQHMPVDAVTGETQYGVFVAMLTALSQLAIPALGLQSVFAQQAVAGHDARKRAELIGTVRGVLKVLIGFWLVVVVLAVIFKSQLLAAYKIPNAVTLWLTLAVALTSIVLPVFGGLVQGRQDFLWFGWGTIMNGVGRFAAVALLVWLLHMQAAGALAGVLIGAMVATFILAAKSRELWVGESAPFAWKSWLRRVVPLTLGLGAFTYIFTQDMLTVQQYFDTKTQEYGAGRLVGQALVFLTAPLAQVLFPKVARSHALSEKSNVLLQAVGATGLIGGLAALGCTIFPKLPLIVLRSPFLQSAPLVPWFTWCMVPLAISNVLINNLLARERFSVVPWLVAVAIGYGVALRYYHSSFVNVIQLLGLFSTLLVVVCVTFTLVGPRPTAVARPSGQAPAPPEA